MKVLHVISGISKSGGGPSRSSQGLVAALNDAGCNAELFALSGERPWFDGVPAAPFASLGDLTVHALTDYDLVHVHGIWHPGLHRVCALCRKAGVPYVIAPRGMLEPWSLKQKWLKKRIARWLYQDEDLRCAVALHATAAEEAAQFKKLGFLNPVIVSPNGVIVPKTQLPRSSYSNKRILFVSRMHPKKGVIELVEAWKMVKQLVPKASAGWSCELVYTVNGEEEAHYEDAVRQRVGELGMSLEGERPDFLFTGPLSDDQKWEAYSRADLFVLPTYSENFGIVVAEALWAGLPVITTKGTPWSELEDVSGGQRAGWWIDLPPKESLVQALEEAITSNLAEMGRVGRRRVEETYAWPAIAGHVYDAYRQFAAR